MPARALFRAAALALCLAGIALVARGVWTPVEAEVSQIELDRAFEQSLARNAPAKTPSVQPTAAPTRPAKPAIAMISLPLTKADIPVEPARSRPIAPGRPLARITVKRLDVRNVVLAGPASDEGLDRGPMMVKRGDADSPVTVLAAHRDTHFLFIRDLREGDLMTLQYVTGEVETYRVAYLETVRWNEFAYPLDPPRPLLALATCYPFGGTEYGGPWRRVAWAERIG